MKLTKEKKTRITLDLSKAFYERLSELEKLVDADTKSSLIRQALQLYEYVAKKSADGYSFRLAGPDGNEQELVFFDMPEGAKTSPAGRVRKIA